MYAEESGLNMYVCMYVVSKATIRQTSFIKLENVMSKIVRPSQVGSDGLHSPDDRRY